MLSSTNQQNNHNNSCRDVAGKSYGYGQTETYRKFLYDHPSLLRAGSINLQIEMQTLANKSGQTFLDQKATNVSTMTNSNNLHNFNSYLIMFCKKILTQKSTTYKTAKHRPMQLIKNIFKKVTVPLTFLYQSNLDDVMLYTVKSLVKYLELSYPGLSLTLSIYSLLKILAGLLQTKQCTNTNIAITTLSIDIDQSSALFVQIVESVWLFVLYKHKSIILQDGKIAVQYRVIVYKSFIYPYNQ